MSQISGPSDGGYSYYHKNIGELEEELENQAKRSRKSQEEYETKLSKKMQDALADREADMQDTIRNVKEASQQANANEREMAKNEINRMRADTYDRFGRSNGMEADVLKEQLAAKDRETKDLTMKARHDLDDATDGYAAQAQKQHSTMQEQSDRALRDTHEALSTAYDEKLSQHKDEFDQYRKDSEENHRSATRERTDEVNFERRRAASAIADMEETHKHQKNKAAYIDTTKSDQRERAHQAEMEDTIRIMGSSHSKEMTELRDQFKDVIEFQRAYAKEKGDARAAAIAEHEDDSRVREQLMTESYEREIDKLKLSSDEQEDYFSRTQSRNLRDKDEYFTKVISDLNRENYSERKRLVQDFDRSHAEVEARRDRDLQLADQRTENLLTQSTQDRAKALEKQAEAYQQTIATQKTSQDDKLELLERELQRRTTSSDSSDISPAAENAIRERVSKHYEKQFNEEKQRNQRSTDSIQSSYANRMQENSLMYQDRETQIKRQGAADHHTLERTAVDHMAEQEYLKEAALRNKDYESQRQEQNLSRNYATTLEKQRREYDQIIAALKDDAQSKLQSIRQESDFKSKMAHRTFVQQQNEISRGYEKKLAEQKIHYETVLDQTKSESNQALREGERKTRQALDEQARSFEQRIAQMELTNKERERNTAEQFEEQLERVKRSNALLISKKS